MSFNNKVVIVTGASSGIGAATALRFSEEGAKVVVVGRNEKKLNDVAQKCEKVGNKPLIIIGDVSNDQDAKRIIKDTIKEFGKIDVLINNAGIAPRVGIMDENIMKVFDQVMSTNLRAVVYLTHLASKYLVETKGNIINISSVAAYSTIGTGMTAYCTSKAALDHFTRTVASELSSKGIRVNTINPGPVKTDIAINMGATPEEIEKSSEIIAKMTALKRFSEPVEIAELALFLASEKAIAITGSAFVSDNGFLVNPVGIP